MSDRSPDTPPKFYVEIHNGLIFLTTDSNGFPWTPDVARNLAAQLVDATNAIEFAGVDTEDPGDTIDTIKPERWRQMTTLQQQRFHLHWARKGYACFRCIGCGFPATHGRMRCEACPPL